MSIYETLDNIISSNLINYDFKYCLINEHKMPFTINDKLAKTNDMSSFVSFDSLLQNDNIENYSGVGISIQASKICAIDVDKCFSKKFDINSADERAKNIIELFKDDAYIEFSFSGTGLRILFNANIIEDYSDKYYIKNESNSIEYYQPSNSYRYVTVTGKSICNNIIGHSSTIDKILNEFLEIYMKRPLRKKYKILTNSEETRTYEELMKLVKYHYFKNTMFQDLWFDDAPGSGSNESERDFHLIAYLYENITQDKELIKEIFESSPFFKSKDNKHIKKWEYQNNRYYNYVYDRIRRN